MLFFETVYYNIFYKKSFQIKYASLIILCLAITAGFYATYPRDDNFVLNRGYNTSQYDFEAVHYIEKHAKQDFIVLSNQQIAAAAVKEFGFKKYYDSQKGLMFYYPIPTGSPLYQYYLDMVYKKPTKKTMEQAMELAGVEESYFAVNRYWWGFDQIVQWTKLIADDYYVIGNEDVYIFYFTK